MNSIPSSNRDDVIENKSQFISIIKKYLIFPIEAGFYGFAFIFSLILMLKVLSFLLGINETFKLGAGDIILSSVGFFFMYLISIRKHRR